MNNKIKDGSWPIYFKDRLIISNLNSGTAVVCLWTPKETIKNMIPHEKYCILGQLYTKKGINYLLRNILARPSINKIYIVGNDLMGSGKAFLSFLNNGVDENYKIISDDSALIEEEIDLKAIELFRNNIEIIDLIGPQNLKKFTDAIKNDTPDSKPKYWSKPLIFPDPPQPEYSRYPSEIDLIKIRAPTIAEAYLSVLKHIELFGLESQPMIGYVSDTSKSLKELLNLSVVITAEESSKPVLPDYLPFNKTDLEMYYKGFFDTDKATEDYTYGERLFNYAQDEMQKLKNIYPWLKIDRFQNYFKHGGFNQIEGSIIKKLTNFAYDKGAIALLANTLTDVFPQRPPRKTPCLFLIQCQIYNNQLHLTAYFRSNDMYNAWPLNAFALRKLQTGISEKLDVKTGNLITISNMAHIYQHNYEDASKVVKEHYKGQCEWDPRGNFHISVEKDEIVVKQVTPLGNEYIREWRVKGKEHKAAETLLYKIIEESLGVSVLGHAADLAVQVTRAETAIKFGYKFLQDNPLR